MSLVSQACEAAGLVTPHTDDWVGVLRLHGNGHLLNICPEALKNDWGIYCVRAVANVRDPKALFLKDLMMQAVKSEHDLAQMVGFLAERVLGAEHGFTYRKGLKKRMNNYLVTLCHRY